MKAGDGDKVLTKESFLSSLLRPMFICAIILLLLDTLMLARTLSFFHFPGELDEFGMAQRGGFGVAAQLRFKRSFPGSILRLAWLPVLLR